MKLRLIPLGKCCRVVSGSTPRRDVPAYWKGNIPWATPKDLSGLETPYIEETKEKITKKGYASCSTQLLPKNSILLSSRAPIGLLAINKVELCTNQGFKNLIPKKGLHPEYLYYVLKYLVPQLQSVGTGTTFKELSKKAIERFEIPVPPSEKDQIRIASMLLKTEQLIRDRKLTINIIDDLIRSHFLRLFGDPIQNERKWKIEALSNLGKPISGGTPSRKIPKYFKGTIPWVTTVALGKRFIDKSDATELITKDAIKRSSTKLVPKGTILIGVRVGVGKTSITRVEMSSSQDILSIINISKKISINN